jgi:hypothetical protein
MTNEQHLERLALDAHDRGVRWSDFWREHGDQVRAAEPYNLQRFRRLVCRLLALVVSGDTDGQQAVGDDAPWEADDAEATPKPADTGTSARVDWSAAGVQGAHPG